MILTHKWESSSVENLNKMRACSKLQFHLLPKLEIDDPVSGKHVFGILEINNGKIVKSVNKIFVEELKVAVEVPVDKFQRGAYICKGILRNYVNNLHLFQEIQKKKNYISN